MIVSPTGRVVGRPFEATQYIHEDMSSLRTELPSDGRMMFAWDGDDLLEKDGYANLHDLGDLLATAAGIRWRQGDGGCETLRGRAAEDGLSGRGRVDVIKGRGGADRLFGGHGRGRIEGRRGDGVLGGGRRADVLRGGKGADRIEGGRGKDVAAGGEGADTSVFGVGDGWLKIAGFEGRGTTLPHAGPWNGTLTARQVVNRFAEDRGLNIGKKGVVIVEDVARAASPVDDIAFWRDGSTSRPGRPGLRVGARASPDAGPSPMRSRPARWPRSPAAWTSGADAPRGRLFACADPIGHAGEQRLSLMEALRGRSLAALTRRPSPVRGWVAGDGWLVGRRRRRCRCR